MSEPSVDMGMSVVLPPVRVKYPSDLLKTYILGLGLDVKLGLTLGSGREFRTGLR